MNAEHLEAVRAKAQSASGAAKKEVLRTTAEKTLRNMILDGYEVAEEIVQDSS